MTLAIPPHETKLNDYLILGKEISEIKTIRELSHITDSFVTILSDIEENLTNESSSHHDKDFSYLLFDQQEIKNIGLFIYNTSWFLFNRNLNKNDKDIADYLDIADKDTGQWLIETLPSIDSQLSNYQISHLREIFFLFDNLNSLVQSLTDDYSLWNKNDILRPYYIDSAPTISYYNNEKFTIIENNNIDESFF